MTVTPRSGLHIRLLFGPAYKRNITPARAHHNRIVARAFAHEAYDAKRPDLIFCCLPTPEMAEKAIEVGQTLDIPVIVDIRDEWPDLYLTVFPRPLRGLVKRILWTEFKRIQWICRNASCITAVSNTYLDWALKYAGRERKNLDGVFPLGYPSQMTQTHVSEDRGSRFKEIHKIRPEALVVTFIGMFGASYDLETVIEAARVLEKDTCNKIQFVLAGDGDKSRKVRKMAHGLSNIVFTGWLDQGSLLELVHISSVGLAPYITGALQSLPNKPFEYLAAGLPILSSLQGELEIRSSPAPKTLSSNLRDLQASATGEGVGRRVWRLQRLRSDVVGQAEHYAGARKSYASHLWVR